MVDFIDALDSAEKQVRENHTEFHSLYNNFLKSGNFVAIFFLPGLIHLFIRFVT